MGVGGAIPEGRAVTDFEFFLLLCVCAVLCVLSGACYLGPGPERRAKRREPVRTPAAPNLAFPAAPCEWANLLTLALRAYTEACAFDSPPMDDADDAALVRAALASPRKGGGQRA